MRRVRVHSHSHRRVVCGITVARSDSITRLSGLLARRGYGYDIVRTVLKTLRDNGELSPNLLDRADES